ncbi:2Fe-2S iron-sulfur cluster-binding protein [Polaromonas sp. SM01]|uniref:2Fe-2S iron-sulfur cluster-binding protein n=1 Tax=Polaromonas sp. SM01 TaxID=3085630 RepID=UPI002981BEA4|nr:2Fe-2S iron-sulfur cluster-binding protein [Polaromonas sp. SM01]MDW5443075.1 2Fe-2S iron-sulfur cluster-binding protein [Polaromonas sp. SM01]
MITINFITSDGQSTPVQGKIGKSLMDAAVAGGIDGIAADCGGLLTCATCHVFVREPFASLLPAADGEELAMLAFTATPHAPHSRLSCQIQLNAALDGLTVELPSTQY